MRYPTLSRRCAATLIDLFLRACIFYAISQIPAISKAGGLAYWVLGLAVLLYEPLLTTYACTLGQALMQIRVRTMGALQRIGFAKAFVRMLVKYSVAIVSVLTISGHKHRRAIHDLAAGTIVVEAAAVAGLQDQNPRS